MSKLVVRVIEESYDSQVCTFEHSIQDDSVILQNDPKMIADEIEELEAAVVYLKGIQGISKPGECFVVIDGDGDVTCAATTEEEAQRIINDSEGDYDYVKVYLYTPAPAEQLRANDQTRASQFLKLYYRITFRTVVKCVARRQGASLAAEMECQMT